MGEALALVDGRVLVLVGRASLGRRLLRGLCHNRHRLFLPAARPDPSRNCRGLGPDVSNDFLVGWYHWDVPSPVLLRHSHGRLGVGISLQRPRSRAAHASGLRRDGRPAAVPNHPLGKAIQMAHLLLRLRCLLEHDRGRVVRLHDFPEFLQTDVMQWLRWLRVPGDTVFFLGAVALVMFVIGLKTGGSFQRIENLRTES